MGKEMTREATRITPTLPHWRPHSFSNVQWRRLQDRDGKLRDATRETAEEEAK
jgi:hypothetical protein